MSFRHFPARHCREWLGPSASGLGWGLWLGVCASLGCAPLGDLDGYSSGGERLGEAPSDLPDSVPNEVPPARAFDAGAEPATGTAQALPADPGPLPAVDAGSVPVSELRISSSVPADGATGVRRDTSLSIAFSEPMDRASVEAAFASDSLPTAAPEFHWDSEGRLLNIVLGAPLSYATGDDPAQLAALRYEYRISSVARDLAGHSLPETRVSFSTLREIQVALSALPDSALTGNWRSDGIYGTDSCAQAGTQLCVGDSSFGPNASYRGFVSFDLSALAAARVELSGAVLGIQVASILGNPFGSLGQLVLEPAAFAAIGPDAFQAARQAALGGVTSVVLGNVLNLDVLAAARADLTGGGRSQYRWLFQSASDGDASTDLLFFNRASATLQLSYLVP
jgi:hypothetical protein